MRFKPLLLLTLVGLAVNALNAQGSDDKERILDARRQLKQAKKHPARLCSVTEAGEDGCFHSYPSEATTWGKRFSECLAKVTVRGKAGFINMGGKLVIPARFKDVGYFSEGLAPFENSNLNGDLLIQKET